MNEKTNQIEQINAQNFHYCFYKRDPNYGAGISEIFEADGSTKFNVYEQEIAPFREVTSKEFDTLNDAIHFINQQYNQWLLVDTHDFPMIPTSTGCSPSSSNKGCGSGGCGC